MTTGCSWPHSLNADLPSGSPPGRAVGVISEELAAETGDHDGQSFVEFGGAVVAGQDGCKGAQAGELGEG